jgi:hypothetical protein
VPWAEASPAGQGLIFSLFELFKYSNNSGFVSHFIGIRFQVRKVRNKFHWLNLNAF